MRRIAWLAVAALAACATPTTSPTDRELLAADVRDALAVAATIPEAQAYVAVVEPILVAFVANDASFDWPAAFDAVRAAESGFREALLSAGWDPMRVETAATVSRMLLRRIEAQVAPQPPPETKAAVGAVELAAQTRLELPPFTEPREVRSVYKGGAWHFKDGVRKDNFGDGTIGIVLLGDRRYYVLMCRMGTPPPGGSFWWVPYDEPGAPYTGWRQGTESWGKVWEPPLKALPKPLGSTNIDTHCFFQNPLTQVISWAHAVALPPNGVSHIERATSNTIDPYPEAYRRFAEVLIGSEGGKSQEQSWVVDPWAADTALFYVRKTTEAPDSVGVRFRSRVYMRRISILGVDTEPKFTGPEKLVFAPDQDGQGAWGTGNGVLQPGICILPDKSYLMAALGRTPIGLPNGQPAVGQMNKTTAVGAWRSFDRGETWKPVAGNPLFSREVLGVVDDYGNPLNSPHFWYDPWKRILYFAVWRNNEGEANMLGTRLLLCEARLP